MVSADYLFLGLQWETIERKIIAVDEMETYTPAKWNTNIIDDIDCKLFKEKLFWIRSN